MFGLMRFRREGVEDKDERRWRMHYCGTCKTIGSRYGQRARLMLNHDAAFLAELLSSLTQADCEQWSQAYRSWNCMSLPNEPDMPATLRYCAAANVLLGEYKVRDHEIDSHRRRWTWARRVFSRPFQRARRDLAAVGFPLAECDAILHRQEGLEDAGGDFAGPTAQATALVFRHGASIAGLQAQAGDFATLGDRFGRLIYWLDAWQDYDRDLRQGSFNAVQATGITREAAAKQIREQGAAIAESLAQLQAPLEFAARLRGNIEAALGSPLRVLHSCGNRMRPAWKTRWREAVDRARAWKAPIIAFAAVVAMALLFPRHARLAKSARECLSLGLNLMALGTMVPVPGSGGSPGRFRRMRPSCCGDCDCCCEAACDSCECCECTCCCSEGCCDSCGSCGDCCSGCDCG